MKEYNLFTKQLFQQGYSFEQYPDYAKLPNSFCDRKLFDILGGFEYSRNYLQSKVYATGCGLLCRGSEFSCGHLSYGGIDWKPENDNPVISCPYRKEHCPLRHPLLDHISGGGLCKISQCNCHEVSLPYDYERSRKKVCDQQAQGKKEKYEEFRLQRNDHVCQWHTLYDEWKEEWKLRYNPVNCARMCMNIGGICDLKHTPLSKKRGNVFYDVKITKIRKDNSLFHGQEEISIKKGCRFLETGTSITICEDIVRYGKQEIIWREQQRYHMLEGWKIEILNIRAQQRESRDLLQDLQDIQNGITVVHASDQEKLNQAVKKQRRLERKTLQERRLERKIIQNGWNSLQPYSADYVHARKWFGEDKIQRLEQLHLEHLETEANQPQQLSLFDFL